MKIRITKKERCKGYFIEDTSKIVNAIRKKVYKRIAGPLTRAELVDFVKQANNPTLTTELATFVKQAGNLLLTKQFKRLNKT